jgi:hypothetical protein
MVKISHYDKKLSTRDRREHGDFGVFRDNISSNEFTVDGNDHCFHLL